MNLIDRLAMTNTTAQIIAYYRRNNLNILDDMKHCTKGLRMAIEQVLSKSTITIRHEAPERPELDLKDVVDSLRGDD